MKTACTLARVLFGLIFLYAGSTKIADPAAFAEIVFNYQILPMSLVNLAALLLPWVEMLCGAALVLGVLPRGAVVVLVLLNAAFCAAMAYNLARGLNTTCGCFSSEVGPGNMVRDLVRDLIFLALGLLSAWCVFRGPRSHRRRWVPGFPHPPKRSET